MYKTSLFELEKIFIFLTNLNKTRQSIDVAHRVNRNERSFFYFTFFLRRHKITKFETLF